MDRNAAENDRDSSSLSHHQQNARNINQRTRQRQRHHGASYHNTSNSPSTVATGHSQYSPGNDQSRRHYQQREISRIPNPQIATTTAPSASIHHHGSNSMYGRDMDYQPQHQQHVPIAGPPYPTPPTSSYHMNVPQQQPYTTPQQSQIHHPHQIHQPAHQQSQQQQQFQQQYHHQQQVALQHQQPMHITEPQPYFQPVSGRVPSNRPLIKLSVSLIDTYKYINKVYYEERDARRAAKAAQRPSEAQRGLNNHGWDDENYDYIVTPGETFNERYVIKERIGKGSFGQVVRAVDKLTNSEVAIKIIKSKKAFLLQAKTEIELLSSLCERADQNNIVRLEQHFMFRNHQCLVFEMLSLNLYELLENTQFSGVSLNLIRKFAKQILKALSFLSRSDIDIIHCDLKPENILLRHPKRSGIKVIDFGSSCRSNKRMYSYIQSRFYRSPEVMLGLQYTVAIDMWSLGCILVEMHTGKPLFSGSDQFDQMQKIVKVLGMVPSQIIDQANDQHRLQFFERDSHRNEWQLKRSSNSGGSQRSQPKPIFPSRDPRASLAQVIGAETSRKKKIPPNEPGQSSRHYDLFVDLIYCMLCYDPQSRIKPEDALKHPFILEVEHTASASGVGSKYSNKKYSTQDKIMSESTASDSNFPARQNVQNSVKGESSGQFISSSRRTKSGSSATIDQTTNSSMGDTSSQRYRPGGNAGASD